MLLRVVSWLDGAPRIVSVAIGATLWMVFYHVPAHLALSSPTDWPRLPLDDQIPVIGWTILIYLSVFIQIAAGLTALKPGIIGRAIFAAFLLLSAHALFFIFMPSTLPRENLVVEGALWNWGFSVMWVIDKPVNCFPSLHVSVAVLAGFSFWRQNHRWGGFFLFWAFLISLSTLTTKQHYFLDIAMGSVIALACYHLVFNVLIPDSKLAIGRTHPYRLPSSITSYEN